MYLHGTNTVYVHGLSLSGCVVQRILDISQNITWGRYTDENKLIRPAEPGVAHTLNARVRRVVCVLLMTNHDNVTEDNDIH